MAQIVRITYHDDASASKDVEVMVCSSIQAAKRDNNMELKDYTTEQLKAELKRRVEEKKAQKAEEMKTAKRCRNCKHCMPNPNVPSWCRGNYLICMARTWGKNIVRNYCVNPSTKACYKFERKEK